MSKNCKYNTSIHKQKHILDTIRKGVVEKWYYSIIVDSMKYLVCRENIPEEFIDIYFNLLDFMDNITIDLWFLKYKPNVFTENIDKIVICMNKWTNSISTKFLKNMNITA
ncbi:hypothetical protein HHI36_009440 [Cryptolaemus montrouzieri]|uniref:Uncharacterized protein n=1 Tax=Cryptolaemus montrouzieri TaxID=559131 RepID=A0ABD2MGH4_9CUCU